MLKILLVRSAYVVIPGVFVVMLEGISRVDHHFAAKAKFESSADRAIRSETMKESLYTIAKRLDIDSEQLYSAVADSSDISIGDDGLEKFGDKTLRGQIGELNRLVSYEKAVQILQQASKK